MERFVFWLLVGFCHVYSVSLENQIESGDFKNVAAVAEKELNAEIRANDFVLLYLYKDDCSAPSCQTKLRFINNLVEVVRLDVLPELVAVRSNSASLAQKHGIRYLPKLLFFRKSYPITFEGESEWDPEEVTDWLDRNRDRSTTVLSDDDFEHLTQAGTGATTGDWFVMFYRPTCSHLSAVWESAAARLKQRINVAKVDLSSNPQLQARFGNLGNRCPALIYFRLGSMYHYNLKDFDYKSLVSFAEGWFKNVKAEKVPVEPSPFDNFADMVAAQLKGLLSTPMGRLTFIASCVGLLLLIGFLIFCLVDTSKPKLD